MEIRCGSNYYRLGMRIGTGACGDVYIAYNRCTEEEVAIKFESARRGMRLTYESMLYNLLAGKPGFPKMRWYGQVGDMHVLVLDRLGPSLDALLANCRSCGRKGFGLQRAVLVADQVLESLKHVHQKGFVHRDIKPDNLLIGMGEAAQRVHIIDFGLARRFRDAKTGAHLPAQESTKLVGSLVFSSLNAHRGCQQSRRDDLEALGHVMIYLLRGKLPWYSPDRAVEPSMADTLSKKERTTLETLCRRCPPEFKTYMQYCQSLAYDEEPDYEHLQQLLRSSLHGTSLGCPSDCDALAWWLQEDVDDRLQTDPLSDEVTTSTSTCAEIETDISRELISVEGMPSSPMESNPSFDVTRHNSNPVETQSTNTNAHSNNSNNNNSKSHSSNSITGGRTCMSPGLQQIPKLLGRFFSSSANSASKAVPRNQRYEWTEQDTGDSSDNPEVAFPAVDNPVAEFSPNPVVEPAAAIVRL